MADPLTIYAVASTGFTMFNEVNRGKMRREANRAQAELYEKSKAERLYRAEENERLLKLEGRQLMSDQVTAVGSSGRDLGHSALLLLMDTARKTADEVTRQNRIAQFEADQLQYRADLARLYGDQAYESGQLGAISAGLSGGYNIYDNYSNYKPIKGNSRSPALGD